MPPPRYLECKEQAGVHHVLRLDRVEALAQVSDLAPMR
jgi:hypothetical protein